MISLKKELMNGVFYIAIAKYSGIITQLIITAILARLLTPSDFGIVAVATVIIAFFNILSDIGIGPAIIQKNELTREDLNNIFSFTCYVGIITSSFFFLLSWPISSYYNDPRLIHICQLLSIPLFCFCLNIVPQNLQYKQKRFKLIAFTTLIIQIISGITSVVAALLGMGLYSLVLSQILSATCILLVYLHKEKLHFNFVVKKQALQKIMSFSIYQFLFNVINYFSRNLDKLMVGRFIGMNALGFYEKSYRLMMLPLTNITFVITPVMQPIFSTFQNELKQMAEKYLKILKLLSYISFPLSALLFFIAEELIYLFFGNQWEESIKPFKILALTVSFQILMSTSGAIYQSANATKQLFKSGCWGAFFMISSFCFSIFLWNTIEAVAYGFFIAQLFNFAQCFSLLFRTLHYPIKRFLSVLIFPLITSIAIGGTLFLFKYFFTPSNLLVSLILQSIIAGIFTVSAIQFSGEYDIKNWLLNRLHFGKH